MYIAILSLCIPWSNATLKFKNKNCEMS
uniref:Uncharacterized protein n=1 Tax=Anguilla anguilla TaxID=7936 RepID=A0A0E9SIF9_ANGAN